MNDAVNLSAVDAVQLLKRGEVSPRELMDAVIDRIKAVDGIINAVVVQIFEEAKRKARDYEIDKDRVSDPSYLAGLPMLAKEFNEIAGTRVCFGSKLYIDQISSETDVP